MPAACPIGPQSLRGSANMRRSVSRALAAVMLFAWGACALARGPWRAEEENTQGWRLMSPEERIEHQAKVRSFRTYEECQAYRVEHHREMEARAKALGVKLGPGREDLCNRLAPRDAAP